jgi:hypothetical protein
MQQRSRHRPRLLSLTEAQLDRVARAAAALPVEKRDVYLQRIATALTLAGRFNDADLAAAIDHALTGLLQEPAA